jgi:hypothetical protein
MEIVFNFNSSWYFIFFGFIFSWAILLLLRRNKIGKKEIKEQLLVGVGGMTTCVLMELFAITTGLWFYPTGNWPVILWPTYFAGILFGFQLFKSIETFLTKPLFASKTR